MRTNLSSGRALPCVALSRSILVPLWFVLCCVLAGCSTKVKPGELDALAASGPKKHSIYLPADDGKPLSPEEMDALISVGDFDRNVSGEDMRDVILHFKHYMHQGRRTVERNVERGEPYLPYIRSVLRKKGLPQELAYLPFIESGYDLQAQSRTGALGMWQFVKGTGTYFGMQRDWWTDERYNPYQSTEAATDYLAKLGKMFNDWHFAITAYNAGEGRVSRAKKAVNAQSFFELRRLNHKVPEKNRLTEENEQYLPRFLAVCKIMRNLDSLGFRKPDSRRALQTVGLEAKPSTDLMALSRHLGMDWKDFSALNPAYLRYISPPRETTVYVLSQHESRAKDFLRKPKSGPGWKSYTVKSGDTLEKIANRNGIPVRDLRRVNQVKEPLQAGKILRTPGHNQKPGTKQATTAVAKSSSSKPAAQSTKATAQQGGRTHTVKAGDTVYGLARAWGVSPQQVLSANNLSNNNLSIGQKLVIPGTGKAVTPAGQKAATQTAARNQTPKGSGKTVNYTVKSGDTVWAIARKFDVPPAELLKANNMNSNSTIKPGDVMRVVLK